MNDHRNCRDSEVPEQIHLSFSSSANQYAVTWSSRSRGEKQVLRVKNLCHDLPFSTILATTEYFSDTNDDGLQYITRAYFQYTIGCGYEYTIGLYHRDKWYNRGPFTINPVPPRESSVSLLVFGDMGRLV